MEEWKEYKLGDVCQVINGRAYKQEELLEQGKYRVLRVGNIFQGNNWYYSDLELSEEKYCYNGDLLYAWSCGFAPYIWEGKKTIYHYHIWRLIEDQNYVYRKFLYYYLIENTKHFLGGTHGSVMLHLTKKDFEQQIIKLPSLPIQRRIASILSSLDDKIEVNRRINENLEAQAQALFKSWFVDFEPFKDGEFVESELGIIPKELQTAYISELPHILETGRRPKGGVGEITKGIPSVGAEHVKGMGNYDYSKTKYISEEYASSLKTGKVNGYELLIYKDGGKPGYFIPNYSIFGEGYPFDECYLNEHVFKLDFNNRGYNAFCYFYFRTDYVMNYLNAQGGKAAIPGINRQDIENILIFSPENEMVKQFGDIVLPLIKQMLFNCKESRRLATLRDTLLPRLMSGELQVNETDR